MSNPVLLLPGYTDKVADLKGMADFLWQAGYHVHPFAPRPSDGSIRLEDMAAQLQAFADLTLGRTQPVDIVGFSMGGLVSRWYVQKLDDARRVQRLITLATPHNGTLFAYLHDILPERAPVSFPGLRQMQPDSDFLKTINGDISPLDKINFSSLWTPLDLTVVPSSSSVMEVGRNVRLPMPHHRTLLTSPRAFEAIVQELRRPFPDQVSVPA